MIKWPCIDPEMKSRIINIHNVGDVLLERSKRARRIVLSVKANGIVRVAVPMGVTFRHAAKFAQDKSDWIIKHQHKLETLPPNPVRLSLTELGIDAVQASKKLAKRLLQLAQNNGYVFNRLSFRNQKTIWGSCSARNNISLNIKLILLPEELIDYVLFHELVHTVHKNHSKSFWQELDGLVGNAKVLDKKLKEFRIQVAGCAFPQNSNANQD